MAEQWEKSVSLQKCERTHSVCPVEEVSLQRLAKNDLHLSTMVHACALCAQGIQKVTWLEVEVDSFP